MNGMQARTRHAVAVSSVFCIVAPPFASSDGNMPLRLFSGSPASPPPSSLQTPLPDLGAGGSRRQGPHRRPSVAPPLPDAAGTWPAETSRHTRGGRRANAYAASLCLTRSFLGQATYRYGARPSRCCAGPLPAGTCAAQTTSPSPALESHGVRAVCRCHERAAQAAALRAGERVCAAPWCRALRVVAGARRALPLHHVPSAWRCGDARTPGLPQGCVAGASALQRPLPLAPRRRDCSVAHLFVGLACAANSVASTGEGESASNEPVRPRQRVAATASSLTHARRPLHEPACGSTRSAGRAAQRVGAAGCCSGQAASSSRLRMLRRVLHEVQPGGRLRRSAALI